LYRWYVWVIIINNKKIKIIVKIPHREELNSTTHHHSQGLLCEKEGLKSRTKKFFFHDRFFTETEYFSAKTRIFLGKNPKPSRPNPKHSRPNPKPSRPNPKPSRLDKIIITIESSFGDEINFLSMVRFAHRNIWSLDQISLNVWWGERSEPYTVNILGK